MSSNWKVGDAFIYRYSKVDNSSSGLERLYKPLDGQRFIVGKLNMGGAWFRHTDGTSCFAGFEEMEIAYEVPM